MRNACFSGCMQFSELSDLSKLIGLTGSFIGLMSKMHMSVFAFIRIHFHKNFDLDYLSNNPSGLSFFFHFLVRYAAKNMFHEFVGRFQNKTFHSGSTLI